MSAPQLGLLDLAPVLARLKAVPATPIKRHGTAGDMAAATAASLVAGGAAATILLLGAEPRPVRTASGPLVQTMDVTVGVVVGVNLAGATGDAGLAKIQPPVDVVRCALFGWKHPGAQTQFVSAGEGIEAFDAKTGVLFYRLDFSTSVILRAN